MRARGAYGVTVGDVLDARSRFAEARIDGERARLEGDCARAIELTDADQLGRLQIVNDGAGGASFVASALQGEVTDGLFPRYHP
jgi:hypothetical protein